MKVLLSFETFGTTHPLTQNEVSEELNPQHGWCKSVKQRFYI